MTDVIHHAVLVTIAGYAADDDNLMPDVAGFRESMPIELRQLLRGPIPAGINGYVTCVFLPGGSKAHWPEADSHEKWRRRFVDLFAFRYDDGSSPFSVAEVTWSDDEHIAVIR